MTFNLMDDISKLTTITPHTMKKLVKMSNACICHDVLDSLLSGSTETEVDIGIGKLFIRYEGDNVKYKFIPTKTLEENVCKTLTTKSSPVTCKAETELKDRVEQAYKHLL